MADATASEAGLQTAGDASLGLHEGISDPRAAGGCSRASKGLALASNQGQIVPVRCRATNLCEYCAKLAAVENSELLQLDALEGTAPAVWACLGTADAERDPAPFYRSREAVIEALRRRWPATQYACLVEFTTGYGARSGGRRRPHWNLLLKGIPAEDVDQAREVILRIWCARENAQPQAQHVGTINAAGGLIRYVAQHFQKASQKPPPGWKGHRFIVSRGYLWTATPHARELAREALRGKRDLHAALELGHEGVEAELTAAAIAATRRATSWELVHLERLGLDRDWRLPHPERKALKRLIVRTPSRAGPLAEGAAVVRE